MHARIRTALPTLSLCSICPSSMMEQVSKPRCGWLGNPAKAACRFRGEGAARRMGVPIARGSNWIAKALITCTLSPWQEALAHQASSKGQGFGGRMCRPAGKNPAEFAHSTEEIWLQLNSRLPLEVLLEVRSLPFCISARQRPPSSSAPSPPRGAQQESSVSPEVLALPNCTSAPYTHPCNWPQVIQCCHGTSSAVRQ